MCLRAWRSGPGSSPRMFTPRNQTSPEVGSIRRRILKPVVDLPHPDSPTNPKVSFSPRLKETSSTACTLVLLRPRKPRRTGKCLVRFRTARSSGMGRPPAGDPVAVAHVFKEGYLAPADVHRLRATGLKVAARRERGHARNHSLDFIQPVSLKGSIRPRDGAHQPAS